MNALDGITEYMFNSWHTRMVGTTVRGQRVECVEVTIDSLFPEQTRVILTVLFRENPPGGSCKEENLLRRVFSDVPRCASTPPLTFNTAMRIMAGQPWPDNCWYLEDELCPRKET
jgi:hypothetical protein